MPRRPRNKKKDASRGGRGTKLPRGRTVKVKRRQDKPCTTKNQKPIKSS